MAVLGRARKPVAGGSQIAGHAVATRVQEAQAELGEGEATLGGGAVVSEATRAVRCRASTGEQRKTDPVVREEFSTSGVANRRDAVRGARAGSGERQPLVRAGTKDAGRRSLSGVQYSPHGGCRGRAEQTGGIGLVTHHRAAGFVKLAEREQPLRIAGRGRCTQMPRSGQVVAGDVPRDQTEGEVSRRIAPRGHAGEMGPRAFVPLGRGALQPLDGFRSVVRRSGLIEM